MPGCIADPPPGSVETGNRAGVVAGGVVGGLVGALLLALLVAAVMVFAAVKYRSMKTEGKLCALMKTSTV